MTFVNRTGELGALGEWWDRRAGALGIVWGRRRVGKTALLERFARAKRAVFHTGAHRPVADELRSLSSAASAFVDHRDLRARPFRDWDDVFEVLSAASGPLLLVLDEFPELTAVSPELPSVIRAAWDRERTRSNLRLLVCGSAVRTMRSLQEERAPLYGRFDLSLPVHPFRPHEAAAMLPRSPPPTQALIWGIVGGIPLYLDWWDEASSVRENLLRLACTPASPLLTEGQLVMATEGDEGDLAGQVLHAIGAGRTKHNEIADAIRADPTRTLERLVELRILERVIPVTEDPRRTRRRLYRIADNFLAFWLGVLDRYRVEIERGLGRSILPVLMKSLDDHMGSRYEDAFREHLRRLVSDGRLGEEIVAVGPWWRAADDPAQIDALVLAGRDRRVVMAGESKWTRTVDGADIARMLAGKVTRVPGAPPDVRLAVCAREEVENNGGLLAITARDIFDT